MVDWRKMTCHEFLYKWTKIRDGHFKLSIIIIIIIIIIYYI